jgi:hypothetical protein
MRSLLVIILIFFSGILLSQDVIKETDKVFGLDPLLYNGKKYSYFLPSGTGGHQFLFSPDYIMGSITIKGKTFNDISLNYDIFNQQLLLQYTSETGAVSIIEVSVAWLESFYLGDIRFEYLAPDNTPRICQVIGEGPCRVLYHWKKELKLDTGTNPVSYTFSLPRRDSFVSGEGAVKPYRGQGSFIALFPPEHKTVIKNYLRENKIKVNKASDQVMARLTEFIGELQKK